MGKTHANSGCHDLPTLATLQPPLPQQPPKQTQQRRHNVPRRARRFATAPTATPVGCAAWRRRFRIFSIPLSRNENPGMTMGGGFFHTHSRGQIPALKTGMTFSCRRLWYNFRHEKQFCFFGETVGKTLGRLRAALLAWPLKCPTGGAVRPAHVDQCGRTSLDFFRPTQ